MADAGSRAPHAGSAHPAATPWQYSVGSLVTAIAYLAMAMGVARSAWRPGWHAIVAQPTAARFEVLAPGFPEGHRALLVATVLTVFVAFGIVCLTFLGGWTACRAGQRPHFTERGFWCTALAYVLLLAVSRTSGLAAADALAAALLGVLVVTALFACGTLRRSAAARRGWQPLAYMAGFLAAQYALFAALACLAR